MHVMTALLVATVVIAGVVLVAAPADAQCIYVNSYHRKDGTFVHGYYRGCGDTGGYSGSGASGSGSYGSSAYGSTCTHVDGYYRADGTYVHGYDRGCGSSEIFYVTHATRGLVSYRHAATSSHSYSIHSYSAGGVVHRDSRGHIVRSHGAKADFVHSHPCPSTGRTTGSCPGWIVDHVIALACGGMDAPSNMQWQTKAAAKAKDAWERDGC